MTKSWEEIVKVKAVDKESVLLGKQSDDGNWRYKMQEKLKVKADQEITIEKTGTNATFHQMTTRQTGIVNDWEKALAFLEASFLEAEPVSVHSSFRLKIWQIMSGQAKESLKLNWQQICFPDGPQLAILASWLRSSKHTVIITGPSTNQKKSTEEKILSVDAFNNKNKEFHNYYSKKIKELNRERYASILDDISVLEKEGHIQSIITEYTNGFHQDSGSKNVYELHGSLKKCHCHFCGRTVHQRVFLDNRNCPDCGGNVRPSVVLLSEKLPIETWKKAAIELRKADLVIVLDTSLQMNPSNKLLGYTNGKTVFLQTEKNESLPKNDLTIVGDVSNNIKLLTQIMSPNTIEV
ncbi:Sir2 family NAD-dependent protein deacetylase [Lottiidibacillus patelloidae]|uniref:Sir2 family NAD-dependent protein deacetylase n=1 Tax=Lottiidibacillus patelloidae TaxID=2670334 RepID=UPI001303AE61|nr:Sir2 family NAD-dependent protein deacetylase [Lottiidibacillus patelloidae]